MNNTKDWCWNIEGLVSILKSISLALVYRYNQNIDQGVSISIFRYIVRKRGNYENVHFNDNKIYSSEYGYLIHHTDKNKNVCFTRPRMVSHTVCRKSNINSICAFILFLFCFSVPLLWKKPLEGRPSNVATVVTAFVTKGTLFSEKYPGNILVTTKYALNNKCRHHNNYRSKLSITQQYRKVDIDTNTIRNTDLEISIYPTLGTYLGMRERG